MAKPEEKERGHVIYEEKTVADLNASYPEDDTVVKVQREPDGRVLLWPISRVTDDIEDAFEV